MADPAVRHTESTVPAASGADAEILHTASTSVPNRQRALPLQSIQRQSMTVNQGGTATCRPLCNRIGGVFV